MIASRYAKKVEKMGYPIVSVSEGNDMEDGTIFLSDSVHIQVGYFDSYVNVVREDSDGFVFYDARKPSNIPGVVSDIEKAFA